MIPAPSFYTDETLMREWNIDRDTLEIFVADGLLTRSLKLIDGEQRQGVTAEERQRFEQVGKREPIQHPAQRRADRKLMAQMFLSWHGANAEFNDDDGDHHYRMRDQLAADVEAVLGMKLPRSRESDALALKEGFEQVRADGWKPQRKTKTND